MAVPRVTIGLPVFNGERYLEETLESLLGQTYLDLHVLVADNASTDSTREIVRAVARGDSRISLLPSDRNRGAAWNYNRLVKASNAELFKWAGYDDVLAPTYIQRCVDALDGEPTAVLAYPDTTIIDAHGRDVGDYEERLVIDQVRPAHRVAAFARRFNLCNACFGLVRREQMTRTGLIRPYVSSDVTFLAEMASLGSFAHVVEPLFRRRVHATSSRQGHTNPSEVARWFNTSNTRSPRAPRLNLAVQTARALASLPVPVADRYGTAASFAAVYAARRTHIWLGMRKASVLRRDLPPPEMIHVVEEQP